jgi:hypothetical protein
MVRVLLVSCALFLSVDAALAAPYTFTPADHIEYGIYFGAPRVRAGKLLTIRYGDINWFYAKYFPWVKTVPTRKQTLRLRTPRGSVIVNRNDNVGLTIARETHDEKKRQGTKRLEVSFQHATCTDAAGISSPCSAELILTTDGPDRGVVRPPRTLTITTSTGLSFTYRSRLQDGGRPITPAQRRAPTINNYAWEGRPAFEN